MLLDYFKTFPTEICIEKNARELWSYHSTYPYVSSSAPPPHAGRTGPDPAYRHRTGRTGPDHTNRHRTGRTGPDPGPYQLLWIQHGPA